MEVYDRRCVYAVEFTDGYAYIGTAKDFKERIKNHMFTDQKSEVYQHKRHTGLIPKFTMVHDYTSAEEADELEMEFTIKYAAEGWRMLNKQKPGGFVGKNKVEVRYIPIEKKVEAEPHIKPLQNKNIISNEKKCTKRPKEKHTDEVPADFPLAKYGIEYRRDRKKMVMPADMSGLSLDDLYEIVGYINYNEEEWSFIPKAQRFTAHLRSFGDEKYEEFYSKLNRNSYRVDSEMIYTHSVVDFLTDSQYYAYSIDEMLFLGNGAYKEKQIWRQHPELKTLREFAEWYNKHAA